MHVTLQRTSWVVAGKQADALLQHERGHYAIALLVAQDTDIELTQLTDRSRARLMIAAEDHFRAKLHLTRDIEARYEHETNHGLLADAQQAWNARMAAWRSRRKVVWP